MKLSDQAQEFVDRHHPKPPSFAEIGRELGISEEGARVAFQRGMRKLTEFFLTHPGWNAMMRDYLRREAPEIEHEYKVRFSDKQ